MGVVEECPNSFNIIWVVNVLSVVRIAISSVACSEMVETCTLPVSKHSVSKCNVTEWIIDSQTSQEVPWCVLSCPESLWEVGEESEPESVTIFLKVLWNLIKGNIVSDLGISIDSSVNYSISRGFLNRSSDTKKFSATGTISMDVSISYIIFIRCLESSFTNVDIQKRHLAVIVRISRVSLYEIELFCPVMVSADVG